MSHRPPALLAALALAAVISAGCVVAASPAASSAPSSSGSAQPAGFYLRAWTTQALAPESSFALAARLAIADGQLIDTAVAVPAIYPGPLLIQPIARPISAHGIATIEDALRAGGLLVTRDFTAGTPLMGAQTAHLEVVVDGTTYELSGDPSRLARCAGGTRCIPDPGTAEAFAAFWQQLTGDPAAWLGADLGADAPYAPERLALLATAPMEVSDGLIQPGSEAWPFVPFSKFGVAYGGGRCGSISGANVETLLPILRRSNQLTHFTDTTGAERSLVVRVLVPGEPDPCTGDGGSASPSAAGSPSDVPSPSGGGVSPGSSGSSSGGDASGSGGSGGSGLGAPTVLGLGCFGGEPVFAAAALSGPATAEQATDAPAQVLRALLRDTATTGTAFPTTGWQRVVDLPTTVLYLAEVQGDPGYVSVEVDRATATGTWARGGYGSCRPMAVLAAPFGPATWHLEAPATAAGSRFTALVTEQSCASGADATGRVSEPAIEYGAQTVTVTFGVRRLDGAQTCPSNPPVAVEVTLQEPLGDRTLVDGALYPPVPVELSNPN